jgi:hypothetical protein
MWGRSGPQKLRPPTRPFFFRNSSGSLAIFAAIRRAKQPELLDGDVSLVQIL